MANTAFLAVSVAWGNVGNPPPNNAVMAADMVVKDSSDHVIYSQPQAVAAQLTAADTQATIAAQLTAAARGVMNDPALKVVIM